VRGSKHLGVYWGYGSKVLIVCLRGRRQPEEMEKMFQPQRLVIICEGQPESTAVLRGPSSPGSGDEDSLGRRIEDETQNHSAGVYGTFTDDNPWGRA
jgi:hypothetical protein